MKTSAKKNPKPNCPEQVYRSHPALGSTSIKTILKNPRKFHKEQIGEYVYESDALRKGRAFHTLLLEPEKFEKEIWVSNAGSDRLQDIIDRDNYITAPCRGKMAKAYKDLVAKYPDKDVVIEQDAERIELLKKHAHQTIISKSDFEDIQNLVDKIKSLKGMERYLEIGTKEQSYFGEFEGVPVKARIDLFVQDPKTKQIIIFDPKSTAKENSTESFIRSSAQNCYYMQEWLYTEVLRQNGIIVKDYLFVQVSTLDYSGAGYYKHSQVDFDLGEERVRKAIQKYKYCKKHNVWPEDKFDFAENKFDVVNHVTLPNYVWYQDE